MSKRLKRRVVEKVCKSDVRGWYVRVAALVKVIQQSLEVINTNFDSSVYLAAAMRDQNALFLVRS